MCDDLLSGYTPEQFEPLYALIRTIVTEGVSPENNKSSIILGGQPGAGKSSFYRNRAGLFDFAAINGDEFRMYHPNAGEIAEKDPLHFAERTQPFSNQVASRLIRELSEEGYSLIIEGTMRNPETPIGTCLRLKEKGYDTELVVIACDAEKAWRSTLVRAGVQKEQGQVPRLVSIGLYNEIVHRLPESLAVIENRNCFDRISIQDRDGTLLYNSDAALTLRKAEGEMVQDGLLHNDSEAAFRGIHAGDVLRRELNLHNWDEKYRDLEEDFALRKAAILSGQSAQMKEAGTS